MKLPPFGVSGWSHRTAEEREANLSQYLHDYVDRRGRPTRFLVRRPLRTARAITDMLRLPRLSAMAIPDTVEGTVIDRALAQRHTRRRNLPHASVLVLPDEPGCYAQEPGRQTLRRMVRKAQRAGITVRRIVDPVEQLHLITIADEWERVNPNPNYRDRLASNEDCLRYRLWVAAYSLTDYPLAVAVTPTAGHWALLRYFRTIGVGSVQSLARYCLMQALAEELVQAGVRYLVDETSPAKLPNGLRHYQRMVGFRLVRLRVRPGGRCT